MSRFKAQGVQFVHGTALMMRSKYNVRGRVAQVVACLGRTCKGIRRATTVISEFIDYGSTQAIRRDDAPCAVEADELLATLEADIDMPVAEAVEANDAFELAPSIVCYCGLPVARYKIHKRTSRWYGEWFIRCPRNHRTEDQCSFFRLCGQTHMPTAGGL